MRIPKSFTNIWTLLFIAVVAAESLSVFSPVQAQSLAVPVNLNWIDGSSSCYGTANGETQDYYGAIAGDSVTFNVTNSSAYNLDVTITESTQTAFSTTLKPGGTASPTVTVNAETVLLADGSACSSGHGGPGAFDVEAATGSVTCTIQNNQVWTVASNYSGIFGTATLYRDSTYVQQFAGIKGSILNESTQFSAMSTPATYSLYYGSSSSARLLGQTTCPAKTSTTATAPSTTPKSTTTSTSTTNNTTATPSTTTSQPAATAKATTVKPAEKSQISTKNANAKKSSGWQWLLLVLIIPLAVSGWRFYPQLRKLVKDHKH